MRVLVTGATGNNGREVMKQLAALNVPTRALVRDQSDAASIHGDNVEIAVGDFQKPSTLEAAMDGVDSAFLISPGDPSTVEMQGNFVQAAVRAKLPHLVKFSVSGANPNSPVRFGKWHAEVEQIIRESEIPFTFLRPNFFMQNFLFFFKSSIAKEGKFYFPIKDAAISMVDVTDNAAVAAHSLIGKEHEGQIYEITGPQAVSFQQAAEILTKALGRPITYVNCTQEENKTKLIQIGFPDWLADGVNEVSVPFTLGYAAEVDDTVKRVGKREPTTFEQFVHQNIAAFQPQQ